MSDIEEVGLARRRQAAPRWGRRSASADRRRLRGPVEDECRPLHPEVEARPSRSARWSWLALLICLGLVAIAGGGVFRVRHVQVVGTNLPVDKIVQTAGVSGQNVFTVRSDRVVARLSHIREIVVKRVDTAFPDRVTIYAIPKTPVVALLSGNNLYELDLQGSIIRQVPTTRLPVIAGPEPQSPLGQGVVRGVRYAVQALATVPGGSIASLRFGPATGLTIVGRTGWTADVGTGTPQTMVGRVATLASLLVSTRNRGTPLEFVDLRLSLPYAHFRGA